MIDQSYNLSLAASQMADQTPLPDAQGQMPMSSDLPKTQAMIVDDEIKSMILTRMEASKVWKEAKRNKWDTCWNHYNQIPDNTNKEKWQSTMFVPASPKVAEVIASNMHSAMIAPEIPAEYQARTQDAEQIVQDVNELIAVDMDKSEFKVHWSDFLKTICILGTAIGKVEYIQETARVKVKQRVKPMMPGFDFIRARLGFPPAPKEIVTEQEMLVKDYASFKNVDPYDFFPQPGSTDISKDNWVIERGKITNYKLLSLQNDPDNPLVNIDDNVLMSTSRNLERDGLKQLKESANDEPVKIQAYLDPDQEHELLEYWGPAPVWMVQPELYGDESRKYEMVYGWFWLLDNQHVVRRQVTPWRDAEPPYVAGNYVRVPGHFFGIGPLELILGLQIELNELRNTRQDNVNLILNKVVAVMKEAVAEGDWGRLISGPGALWAFSTTGGDDIRKILMPFDFPDVTSDSWRSSQEVYNEIQEVTAATKATIGTGGGADQEGGATFRGQLLNKQTSADRFIMYARILERTSLSASVRKYYSRIYQFKSYEAAQQIVGQNRAAQFEFIPPEVLEQKAKLVPLGVTALEQKGVKLAQERDMFMLLQQYPWFKAREFAQHMAITAGDGDPDRFIFSDEEMQIFNQQKAQMIQENLAAGGGPMNPASGGPSSPPAGPPQPPPPPMPNGRGLPPNGPIAGGMPGPTHGMPRPSMPARGPGASPIDVIGRPAA